MNAKSIAAQVSSLFTLPEVALKINEALDSPKPSNDDLEKIIISDPALTANILKLVNSAYFGFPAKIDTVSRAITVIGHKELWNLVITTSVTTSFKKIPAELIDMDVFWFHSVTSAVLARLIAKTLKYNESERLFIGGLLHSIGRLIYITQCPEQARQILELKDQGEDAMLQAEQALLGFTYAELGAEFLKQWELPSSIWQMIEQHLDPLNANKLMHDACILHLAAKIASSIEPCAKHDFDFEELEPHFQQGVIDYLKISPNKIDYCISESHIQAFDILSIITPGAATIY